MPGERPNRPYAICILKFTIDQALPEYEFGHDSIFSTVWGFSGEAQEAHNRAAYGLVDLGLIIGVWNLKDSWVHWHTFILGAHAFRLTRLGRTWHYIDEKTRWEVQEASQWGEPKYAPMTDIQTYYLWPTWKLFLFHKPDGGRRCFRGSITSEKRGEAGWVKDIVEGLLE